MTLGLLLARLLMLAGAMFLGLVCGLIGAFVAIRWQTREMRAMVRELEEDR